MGDMGGVGRIYFTALDRYADRFGIEGEDFSTFLRFMRALDDEFLLHLDKKRKAEAENRKNKRH